MKIEKDTKKVEQSKLKIFTFNEAYIPPVYSFVKKGDVHYLSFGKDNLYPYYILSLFNNVGSSLHKAIINKKSRLSAGFGIKPIVDPKLSQWVKDSQIEQLFKYISKDFELYNGFCIEVQWSNDGSTCKLNYIPLHSIRIGLKEHEDDPDYFWYSTDWALIKKDEHKPEYIKKYDPSDRTGRQLIYYVEPNPAHSHLYPIPNYSTCMQWIELDYQISVFHLNQIKQSYTPSMLISFNTGVPTIDEQNETWREFERNFKGAYNSGKTLITYADSKEHAPEITPIALNDSDERFIMLADQVRDQITQAHEMPQQLVSFVPGKLGSTEERAALMAELQTYYTTPRQEQLEYVINKVSKDIGFTELIKLKQYTDIDESGILTEDKPTNTL
jgi:hypothetical protein